jgi:hypothetical protein
MWGNQSDKIPKISTDSNGNIFISGDTASSDNISTNGAFQS